MEKLVGILYVEEQKAFGKKADTLIDFNKFKGKNRWVNIGLSLIEKKDDDIFTAGIKYLDDRLGEKIPVNFKPSARALALAVINEDKEAFSKAAPELIGLLVDIPNVTKETEAIVIGGLIQGIVQAFGTKF